MSVVWYDAIRHEEMIFPMSYPYPPPPPPATEVIHRKNSAATAGLVLGICAIVFFWIPVVGSLIALAGLVLAGTGLYFARQLRNLNIIRAIIGLALSGLAMILSFIVAAAVFSGVNQATKPVVTATSDAAVAQPSSVPPDTTTSSTSADPPAYQPTTKDFEVVLRIISKECFGEAGCSVAYKTDLQWAGNPANKPADDTSYDVTYQVIGFSDGPQSETFTTHGGKYSTYEGFGSTASSATTLHAKITSVTRNY